MPTTAKIFAMHSISAQLSYEIYTSEIISACASQTILCISGLLHCCPSDWSSLFLILPICLAFCREWHSSLLDIHSTKAPAALLEPFIAKRPREAQVTSREPSRATYVSSRLFCEVYICIHVVTLLLGYWNIHQERTLSIFISWIVLQACQELGRSEGRFPWMLLKLQASTPWQKWLHVKFNHC